MRSLLMLLAPCFAPGQAGDAAEERVCALDLLDNGGFEERTGAPADEGRVAWWMVEGQGCEIVEHRGRPWLATTDRSRARQPIAAHAPLADGLEIRGAVRGRGRLVLVERASGAGQGGALAEFELGASGEEESFAIQGEEIEQRLGHRPTPRLELQLLGAESEPALWTGLEVLVPLPCPTPEELRREVLADLEWIFATWLAKGIDAGGRFPAFVTRYFDAVSGETLSPIAAGLFPLFGFLLDARDVHHDPAWEEALERFLLAYLEIGLHPVTGLPRKWDVERAAPQDGQPIEIATDLGFLLDVAERGPEDLRGRARAAALRMGETVLAHGVLPDGMVASLYRPGDASVFTNVAPLRRLDVPAQLARLAAASGDERFLDAARGALAELEYTHLWFARWDEIDPGFDDDFGTYGGAARTMLAAFPEEQLFRGWLASGFEFFAPLWREALRGGGSIAADQVRCWELLVDLGERDPELMDELRPLLAAALRAHFKGEQYANGAWGDVTFFGYDPKTGLEVGDLPGTPSNLLHGLAVASRRHVGLDRQELRAMFTAVLRSTREHYRRAYGYLLTQREHRGHNGAGGGLRMAEALLTMLGGL